MKLMENSRGANDQNMEKNYTFMQIFKTAVQKLIGEIMEHLYPIEKEAKTPQYNYEGGGSDGEYTNFDRPRRDHASGQYNQF